MKRTTFRGVPVLLLTVDEAGRITARRPLDNAVIGYPHKYGIRHAKWEWENQQKRIGRYNVNRYAILLASKPIDFIPDTDGTIKMDYSERQALHEALEGKWHSGK